MATTTPPSGERLYRSQEAADYLQISRTTLKHWVTSGDIEFVRVGRLTRFTKAGLDRYIASRTVAARD